MFACLWCGDEVKPQSGVPVVWGKVANHVHPVPCGLEWQQKDLVGWADLPHWLATHYLPMWPWTAGKGFHPECTKYGLIPAWMPPPWIPQPPTQVAPSGIPPGGFFPPGTLVLRDVPEVMMLEPEKLYAGCWKCGVQLCEALDQYLGSDPRGRGCCINCQRKLGIYA